MFLEYIAKLSTMAFAVECNRAVESLQEQVDMTGLDVFLICDQCGYGKRVDDVSECIVCWLKSENLVLSLEQNNLREEVRKLHNEGKSENEVLNLELSEEVKRLRDEVERIRQDVSVRPKDRSEEDREAWPAVEASRIERRVSSQAGKEDGDRGQWCQVVGGRKAGVYRKDRTDAVECSNRFSVLEAEKEIGLDEEIEVKDRKGKGVEVREREGVSSTPQVCVVGDSQVRYLGSTFCGKNRSRRRIVCMPGAGVKEVREEVQRRVQGMERECVVVLHVGGNDVSAGRSEELVDRYEGMIDEIKESGRRCVVSGILPRVYLSREWMSRAIGVNERVKELCRKAGASFVDEWDRFFGRRELYAWDGVHLSRKGVDVLSNCLEKGVEIECRG